MKTGINKLLLEKNKIDYKRTGITDKDKIKKNMKAIKIIMKIEIYLKL